MSFEECFDLTPSLVGVFVLFFSSSKKSRSRMFVAAVNLCAALADLGED